MSRRVKIHKEMGGGGLFPRLAKGAPQDDPTERRRQYEVHVKDEARRLHARRKRNGMATNLNACVAIVRERAAG